MTPRILLGAPASGSGKTTVTCALLQALMNRKLKPMACKSGPDYIDPMFHSTVLGAKTCNLDLFFFEPAIARALLKENSQECDVTILEGAMGYYDGIGFSTKGSAWELAKVTETPAILVVDGRGRACSVAAEVAGFLHFQPDSQIKGVIFNQISPMLYPQMARAVQQATGLPSFGYLPKLPDCVIESRHLGLKTAGEISNLRSIMAKLGQAAEECLEIDAILSLARTAPDINDELPQIDPVTKDPVVVAVAMDEAFCFYYQDSLQLLEKNGVKLEPFSPLHDRKLPDHCAGLYLGGGYPELYAPSLSKNIQLRREIHNKIAGGLPTIAECGGFLYLQSNLLDRSGAAYPMVGIFPGTGFPTEKLQRFGYATMTAKEDSLILAKGDFVPVHEFHYWNTTEPGQDFYTQKPQSQRGWDNAIGTKTLYAGFPHFHFWAQPNCAKRFVEACVQYQEEHL
jgi:cobyrinic acid a,c-diamide synthase